MQLFYGLQAMVHLAEVASSAAMEAENSFLGMAAKGLVTDLYVAYRQLEAAKVDIFQKVLHISRCFPPPNTS